MEVVPAVLCIDVEPDDRVFHPDDPPGWRGVDETLVLVDDFRRRLADATGRAVRFTWTVRADPQIGEIWGAPDYAFRKHSRIIDQALEHGDAIGLHTHAWRWDPLFRRWVLDLASQEWVDHCERTSFSTYHGVFGRRCAVHRFGDRWLSTATIRLVQRLGARVDLTLEPGLLSTPVVFQDQPATAPIPATIGAPRRPFRPSRRDCLRPARSRRRGGTWMLPLTNGAHEGAPVVYLWDPQRHPGALGALTESAPYLAFAIRTETALPSRPYRAALISGIEEIVASSAVTRLVFTTPEDALARLLG